MLGKPMRVKCVSCHLPGCSIAGSWRLVASKRTSQQTETEGKVNKDARLAPKSVFRANLMTATFLGLHKQPLVLLN
jgi:hypothetical protein